MCKHCNYTQLLEAAGLDATENRFLVMEVIGNNNYPLTAAEVFSTIERSRAINKVTVYRILDLLVEKQLLEKIHMGGRAAHYGLAPNAHHAPHPHFYCKSCGAIDCLPAESLSINMSNMNKTFPGKIERVEVQVEGICHKCLK